MNLQEFKTLLSIPSKTYLEGRMVEYIVNKLSSIDGVNVIRDKHNNVYATKGTIGPDEFYPMFISHTDTVHNIINKIEVREEHLSLPYTFGKEFGDDPVLVLKAYDENGNPTGIGGDDKCGIFACIELIKQLDKVKLAFFVSEETGCHGSKLVNEEFLKDVGYCVQYDAPGNHLITYRCSGVELFDIEGGFFNRIIPVVTKSFGNEMLVQNHPYTDIKIIKEKSDFSCINLSCGYYNMHTKNEFISVDDVKKTIQSGLDIVKELGLKKYPFKITNNNNIINQ
jgi:putative aminopeptidase FrvX